MIRWWLLLLWWSAQCGADTLSHGRFENLAIYRPSGEVQRVVLFLSGEQGWNEQLSRSAQLLASQGALVAGIDSRALFANLERDGAECVYPDGDLENLSHFLQAYYRLPSYEPSVLVGYGSGGTFSYAMLAQAPAETFAGGISIDFCPELRLRKRLCETNSLHTVPIGKDSSRSLLVRDKLAADWIVFQSPTQRACRPAVTQKFVNEAPGTQIQPVSMDPKSGNWEAALQVAVQRLDPPPKKRASPPPEELAGLPIVEVPTKHAGSTLAIFLSGDGGWAGIDKDVAGALAAKGIPVVGWNSLQYFWSAKKPEVASKDLERVLRHYLAAWDKTDVLLIGYSFGADVLPATANHLPVDLLDRVKLIALLGPSQKATFEFHVSDWLGGGDSGQPVLPEVKKLGGRPPVLCLHGAKEDDSLCPELSPALGKSVELPGSHHFGGDYEAVASLILKEAQGR